MRLQRMDTKGEMRVGLAAALAVIAIALGSCSSCEGGGNGDGSAPSRVPKIYIELDKSEVRIGEPVVASVRVENIENLYGAAFDIVFSSDAIELVGRRRGDFWGEGRVELMAEFQSDEPKRLVVGASLVGDAEGRSGSGTLALFELKPSSRGTYSIALQSCTLKNPELETLDVEVGKPTELVVK